MTATNHAPKCWIFNFGYNGYKVYETPAGLIKVVGPPNEDGETIQTAPTIKAAFVIVGLEYRGV